MNRTLTPLVFALGTSSLLLMDSAIKGSVILLGAACLAVMLKRDSAAMRHLVWLVAIVAMLFIPVLSVLLPRWQVLPAWAAISQSLPAIETPNRAVELPRPFEAPTAKSPELIVPGDFSSQRKTIDTSLNSETHAQSSLEAPQDNIGIDRATSDPSWSWMTVLPFLWSIGFGVLILRLMAARWMLWSNEKRATVIAVLGCPNDDRLSIQHESDAAIASAFESAHRQLGIRQRVQLLIDSERTIPVVWGIFWIRLMLPDSARQWSSEQLRSVLLHELAHIKRHDTIVQLLTQFACALHWFNPLVWFAAWRLHVERERACDDLVLAQGVRASAYAEHLLNVATKLTVTRWTSACGLAMASHSPLESRLHAILSDRLNRRKVSTAIGMIGLLLGAGIVIPVAMLRAAPDDWNPPSGAHVGSNDFSAYCVHDGKNAAFVIAYQGFTGSSSAHDSNSKTRTWTDSGTLTAKKSGIALSFHRAHIAPDKLSITTAPSDARDLSKPAPPRRDFGQKEYDLNKGRVFLLSDNGSVRQLDVATPIVTDQQSAMKLAALIAAIPPQEGNDAAFMTNFTVQLSPETIAKLKWGEPVNGLRMALAYPPALGDAMLGKKSHFELVVQNVSEKEIHFLASKEAPNPRNLYIREGDRIVLGLSDPTTSAVDWKLQPSECSVVRMYTKEESNKDGTIPSSGIESDLSKLGRYHAIVHMEIAKAPEGAWTGKLITGETRGSADVAAAPTPLHKDAQALYEVWQRYARTNGDIPGALVGELAASVMQFIKYNPTWETVPKLKAILPRLDATRDWKQADAIALLDEVAGILDSPLSPAPWKGTRNTIRHGDALPTKYADVAWGEEQPNSLRAAWVLEPSAAEHRIGAALKARLLVQNRGQVPVMLQVPTWHQGWVKASDANGKEVEASGLEWTTMAMLNTVRLGPGAYIEINTPGVGIGPRAGMGPWAGPRVGSNVIAKPGDELTLTYSLVPLDGSEVGVSEEDPHVSGPLWWLAHIKTRLNRELPLPEDAAERTRMLDRAVRELFATAPTAEETAAFIADKTPDAIDALAKRLVARVDVVSFSGKLPTAPVKFRVLDAVADADKQPRVVLGPGQYPLSGGTATSGAVTLKIIGRPVGDRRTNDAGLLFEATEATGKLALDPHKLDVPDGWGTWAIVCRPGEGFFYLLTKGAVRKIDYANPREVTDTPANDLPAEFRDEVKRQLDIHEISADQQAEIFEKPVHPAEMPRPKGAAVKLTLESLIGTWRGKLNNERLLLSFQRPSAENEIQADLYIGAATVGMILKFTIAPDGSAVNLTLGKAEEFGRLTPLAEGVCQLELSGQQKGPMEITITRDNEQAATEPGQKEPRELFAMWKATANADGKIPGTFIGQLASEVRTYVKEHPTLDSAAKLSKLLPRFVTSRDWTQAEAIKLLDDVAYYATEPIAARVAKAKLPSSPLWRTEVEFEDIPVQIAKWSEVKDGLRIGMRIVEADWHIGGKARVELWLHNAGGKDVAFKTTGATRQDVGITVSAIDVDGQEHWAENGNVAIIAEPLHCMLPAGHVAMAKALEITFAAPDNDEEGWMAPRFRDLKPGKYQLRCKWMDAHPTISKAGDWTGELTAPELDFTLAEVVAAPQASVTPKTTDQEPITAWGKEFGGLQAGLGFKADEKRAYHHGETAKLATGKLELKVYPVSSPPANDIQRTVLQPDAEGLAYTPTQSDWVLAWDFRITPLDQQYSKMRISKDGKLETILRKPPLLRTQLSSEELSALIALVAKNPQAKPQPISKLAKYSKVVSPTPELFEALKKVQVRSEIIAVVHEGELFELDLNTTEAMVVDGQLKKMVGLAAIGGSEELSRLVELANRELMRKYSNLSTPIDPADFSYGDVDHPSGMISVWFNYSINPASKDGQMVLLRISENGQPSIEQVILPGIVKLDELDVTEWKLPNADANIVKVPDDQYVKSSFPVDELAGEGVTWNDVQNGLSLGYRITGDEWRILGKEVKVELWVQNHGDKEVKFQDNMRADPEFGLRVKLTDAKGEDHNSNFWPDDRPPFGFHRLLPPGHALKVKEFTISLFLPENDFSHAKGHFFGINPGAYNFHCELALPGFSATGEGGKQLTPSAGEWTSKLTTCGLKVEVVAPDAPAPKPRVESVVVGISKDGEISLDRKKMPLDELKTRVARIAKKWFTIQADEDVPYAKVIAVIEALKASGVTQFSFAASGQEILPVSSKELSGIWYGATDRTGVVVRFIGRESRVIGVQGVVSGEWVVHVVDGSIGAALEFTDEPKTGVVRITGGMWDDKIKQSYASSLGTIERGKDDTLYLTINDNPKEPMYLATKRIPLTLIDERNEIQRSDVEKMQSLMRTLQQKKPNNVPE